MRTNTLATLYNKYRVAGAETYQRWAIGSVSWENRKARNVLASGGNLAADQAYIYIPFANGAFYVGPKQWQALADKTGAWTLQVGDVLVKGDVADLITVGFTMTQLRGKYDDVLVISSVDTMDLGSEALRHWVVSAK